ncbi:MAG: archease [bacterium]
MYKYLDHTSDIGILVKSKNLKGLFEEAVFAMFSLIGKINAGAIHELPKEYNINLEDNSYAELLVRFLNEFLYFFYAKNFLPVKISVPKTGKFFVESRVSFVRVNEKNFTFLREIKAATYHGASVSGGGVPSRRSTTGRHPPQAGKSFQAKILFDV